MKGKFLLCGLLLTVVFGGIFGCKGKAGPAGVSGTNGANGTSATSEYTAVFTNGVAPSSFYSGTTMNRIDSASPTTNYQNDGNVHFGGSSGEVSAILIMFDITGLIPANATLESAVLELVANSSTSLGGAVTVGVHEMKTSGCPWIMYCNWNTYDGATSWSGCGGVGVFNSGAYNTVMGSATLPTSYNGGTNRIGLAVSTSTISDWMAGNNNGLAVVSEHQGSDATGLAVFVAPNFANTDIRPTLKVNYKL
jgi:hypothetical protein